MNTVEMIKSNPCFAIVPTPPSDFLPPYECLLNDSVSREIDLKIIEDFNKKTFESSAEISFEGFSSTNGSNTSELKLNTSVDTFYKAIMEKLTGLENSLFIEKLSNISLKDQIHKLDSIMKKNYYYLNKDIDKLYEDLNEIDYKMIQLDQYTRRESLVISGIDDRVSQDILEKTVLNILSKIGINVSSYEVTACHRLYNKNRKYPSRTIIRFTNRKIVDYCLKNRDRLLLRKNELKMNLRFYEHLTDNNETVLKECSNLVKYGIIKSYFIRNGFVKIVVNDGDNPFKIIHPHILYDKFKDFFDYDELNYMP